MIAFRTIRIGLFFCSVLALPICFSAAAAPPQYVVAEVQGEQQTAQLSQPVTNSAAASPPSAAVSAAAVQKVATKMQSVERIHIRVPGVAALSGEYRLNADGTLSMPGLGRLQVGDTTLAELEAQLASEIQRVTNRESSVAIEVVDYRPIFVSGVVARAGSFPWKPGYSVLHAETLAGGLFRGVADPISDTAFSGSTGQRERAVRSAYELAATLTTIERLRAELSNEKYFSMPPRVAELATKAEQEALREAQIATLKSRVAMFNAKVVATETAKMIATREIKALEEQSKRVSDQLSKRRAIVKQTEYMTENRFARGDLLFEAQVRVAELEERLTTTTLAISRAEAAANAARQELETLVLSRKSEIDLQILGLEQKKAEFEIAIESANSDFRRLTGQDAIAGRGDSKPLVPHYLIVRSDGGMPRALKGDTSTQLMPGDVLVVSFGKPNAS